MKNKFKMKTMFLAAITLFGVVSTSSVTTHAASSKDSWYNDLCVLNPMDGPLLKAFHRVSYDSESQSQLKKDITGFGQGCENKAVFEKYGPKVGGILQYAEDNNGKLPTIPGRYNVNGSVYDGTDITTGNGNHLIPHILKDGSFGTGAGLASNSSSSHSTSSSTSSSSSNHDTRNDGKGRKVNGNGRFGDGGDHYKTGGYKQGGRGFGGDKSNGNIGVFTGGYHGKKGGYYSEGTKGLITNQGKYLGSSAKKRNVNYHFDTNGYGK